MHILVTGAAGFIGFHLCKQLLEQGRRVVGLDNFNDYYDVSLKESRVNVLQQYPSFTLARIDLSDFDQVHALFHKNAFTHVVHLAAQAGVRYSLQNPHAYIASNVNGFFHVMECCKLFTIAHFVFASSSSVYGLNTNMPFSVLDNVDHPISLYAATKKSNELMAHSYSYLFHLPCSGLRFFTVYGPWGRPDMALFLFTKAILEGKPIQVFNHGRMERDFTYIDDIVEGVCRILFCPPSPNILWSGLAPDPSTSPAPYKIFNIGNNKTVSLAHFIEVLEKEIGEPAVKEYLPLQPGDVPATFANIDDLFSAVGYRPATSIEEGIHRFVTWYRDYFQI